jgi:hypothetical protein
MLLFDELRYELREIKRLLKAPRYFLELVIHSPWILVPTIYRPLMTSIHLFPKQKLIYVEVPKAACTSIKIALSPLRLTYKWTLDNKVDIHLLMGRTLVKSKHLERILRKYKKEGWVIFTVVRNPLNRFRSLLIEKILADRSLYKNRTKEDFIAQKIEFDLFLEKVMKNFSESYWYKYDSHGRPQVSLIGKDLSIYDFIGKTEEIEDAFHFLKQFVTLEDTDIRANDSHIDPSWQFPPSMEQKIYSLYKEDFEVLGYQRASGSESVDS